MADPFVGEIRIFGFNFAPIGWAQCNGQLMPISQNTALFSLLGTFYGGDGKSTFALPDLQGRGAMHQGTGPGLSQRFIGEIGGETVVTLLQSEMPAHSHSVPCNTGPGPGTSTDPTGRIPASAKLGRQVPNLYSQSAVSTGVMDPSATSIVGSSLPHNNMAPYLVMNFCIALQGVFPSRP